MTVRIPEYGQVAYIPSFDRNNGHANGVYVGLMEQGHVLLQRTQESIRAITAPMIVVTDNIAATPQFCFDPANYQSRELAGNELTLAKQVLQKWRCL